MKAEIKTEMDGRIQHLAVAWLEGTATPAEVEELWEWVKQSEAHYRQLVGLQKEWIRVGREVRYDVNKGFEALKVRLADLSSARRKRLRLRVVGWAAAVMLLLAGGGLWWMQQGVAVQAGSGEESQIVPGSNKAVLVLGTNERVELDEGTADSVFSDTSLLKKAGNRLVYSAEGNQDTAVTYNRLITPRGGEYSVVLADGTQVWLNAESELRDPEQFAGEERRVYLRGEAYFDVAKCEGKKFIVHSGAAQVTVLGTEFNVKNYEDGAMAATLVEGSVLVDHAGQQCALVPGQQAMVDKEGIEVKEVETILYTAWKDGYFIYREASLDDIMQELSRWYDFTYFYQNSRVADLSLTAKLRKFDHVEDVFGILKMTGQVDFVVKGKTVTVMAK